MSELIVRPYQEADEEGFYSVISLTYHDGVKVPEERRKNEFGGRFVAIQDGQVAGVFSTLNMKATRGSAVYDCAGVAAVAVSPDIRRGGVGVAMMDWSIGQFKRSGQALASLYAYRETFYGKSGYVVCGKRLRLSVPTHRLPKVQSSLGIRRLAPTDWRELAVCQQKFAHARSGVSIRSEGLWGRVLAEVKPLTIYAAGDPIEGYVAVSHKINFWEEQWLSEVVWSTKEGYEACIGIMHQLGINKTSLAWNEPSDSPYYARYLDQGVVAELNRPACWRVCDVAGALKGLKPETSGEFTLLVEDHVVEDNRGPFRVRFTPDGVAVENAPTASPDLEFGIREFTQAFLGDPCLQELAEFGSVKVHSGEALASAKLLLPHLPVYCSDFF